MTIDSWNLPVKLRIANNGFDGLLQVGQTCTRHPDRRPDDARHGRFRNDPPPALPTRT
jgi:hypothetical protein